MKNTFKTNDPINFLDVYSDVEQITKIFNWFVMIILFSLVAGIIIVLSTNDYVIAFLIFLGFFPTAGAYIFIRQKKFEIVAVTLALVFLTLLTIISTFGLGIHHISNIGYPAILIIASLVTRRRTMVILVIFSIVCIAWLVFGEIYGLYVPKTLEQSVAGDFFSSALIVIASAIMVRFLSEGLLKTNQRLSAELQINKITEDRLEKDILLRLMAEEEIRRLNAQLELRVKERTEELESANRELESFSYSISHDLRAPLRGILGFSALLEEEHASQLDESALHFLARIQNNATSMNSLINDLLAFSRLGKQTLQRQPVNMKNLAYEVYSEFGAVLGARNVNYIVGDIPDCLGDASLLKVVMVNLLSNALKYTQPRDPAEIVVNSLELDGKNTYFVRDNGVGFDMAYANKLFGVFQRLHSSDQFDGTGIGLATVQRIIHYHGGRIWAEAEKDKGATFFFTLGLKA